MKKIIGRSIAIFITLLLAFDFKNVYCVSYQGDTSYITTDIDNIDIVGYNATNTVSYTSKAMENGTKVNVATVTLAGVKNYNLANEVFDLINKERTSRGLKPLVYSKELTDTAMKRAAETAIYWSHERPCGLRCFTLSDIFDGENLGALTSSPEKIMKNLMASEKHRGAILKEYYQAVGVGCYQVNGVTYWAQHFSIAPSTDSNRYTGKIDSNEKIDIKVNDNKIALNIYGLEENITLDLGDKTSPSKVTLTNKGITSIQTQISLSDVKWTSSDKNVFTVDKNGKITAVGSGEAKLIAQIGEVTNTINIKVNSKLKSISLPATTIAYIGKPKTIDISYNPITTTDSKLATWKSEDETIATVDSNGIIRGLKKGATKITATVGNLTSTCLVIVEEYVDEDIYFSKDSETILIDNEIKVLDFTFKPGTDTKDDTISWFSSDENIAIVDDNGEIKVLSEGVVTITAKTNNGKVAECTINVIKNKVGDIDGNGIINGNDAAMILDIYNKGISSDKYLKIADIDGNGIINGTDAALLLDMYNKGII